MPAPKPKKESKRLAALKSYRMLDTSAEQAFDDFVFLATTICQTPVGMISFVDSDRQCFKAKIGIETNETPRDHAFCAHAILGDEVMVVQDAMADERFSTNPLVTSDPHIRFYAGAPLIDRDGNALGTLCVIDRKPRPLGTEQKKALEALAREIMCRLELNRITAELAEALSEVKTLHGLLPICSHCKGIRNDTGYWQSVEKYISTHSDADFSHDICPDCLKIHHPEVYEKLKARGLV